MGPETISFLSLLLFCAFTVLTQPVCHYAKQLLESIYYEPVFDVKAVNPALYNMVPALKTLRVSAGVTIE